MSSSAEEWRETTLKRALERGPKREALFETTSQIPLEAAYTTYGAFPRAAAPVVVAGRGCEIDPAMVGAAGGVRDVVVDVTIDKPQRVGVALRAHSAVVLRAGGRACTARVSG